ncbi:MAG: polysaccharide deacetylase family protein [Candidatus Levybacteria bacterium]|nr:polysaccharide deacetylase family protein [Candidatus Levybacteria bacterium]
MKLIKRRIILLSVLFLSIILIENLNHYGKSVSNAAKAALEPTISTPVFTPLKSLAVPILIYHYIEYVKDEKDTIRKSLNTNPYLFTNQVETLRNAGYTFITASDLIDILEGKIRPPKKPVLLTFDDGYQDFYTDAFPILRRYNVKAVVYVVSGFLDMSNYLSTLQLKEIAKSGLVEIGAHTVHHLALKGLNSELAKSEIEESKKTLERLIDTPVVSFAYPDGSFDKTIEKLIQEAGYRSATTTLHGLEVNMDNRFALYRLHPGDKTGNLLLNFLAQK